MKSTFITFQKFNSCQDAEELIANLKKSGIEVEIEDASPPVDITFSGNTMQNEIRVKIQQSDFDKANQILEKQAKLIINQFPKDYYLFSFTDDELIEIIEKPDEWSKEDYLLSQKILKDKGHDISKEKIENHRINRFHELRKPEKGQISWLIFGFVCSIFGGIISIFIGWIYWKYKKTDPEGKRIYMYDQRTRKTGKVLFWVGIIFFIIFLIRGIFILFG